MKIFNVSIRVSIQQVAEIPDRPTDTAPVKEPFNDDPLDKADKILSKHFDRLGIGGGRPIAIRPGMVMGGAYGTESDGASMSRSVRVAAESFEELQAILAKFNDAAKQLAAVPDSLLTEHAQNSLG